MAEAPAARRGPDRPAPGEPLRIVPASAPARVQPAHFSPGPVADFHLVRQRLDALERLSLLRDIGVLDSEEFAAEKALVLRLPAEELELSHEEMLPEPGPSLLGRLLSWKMVAAGAIIGVGVSAFTAPQDLLNLADRLSRLIG